MENNQVRYAGFWIRVGAMFVDAFCLSPFSLISIWMQRTYSSPSAFSVVNIIVNWLLPAIIILSFWKIKSATPGKLLMSIKIVDVNTNQPASTALYVLQ